MPNESAQDDHAVPAPETNGAAAVARADRLPDSIGDQLEHGGDDNDLGGHNRAPISGDGFSPLNVEDRVVISLLFNEAIRVEHVERAWHRVKKHAQDGTQVKLWRSLAEDPSLDAATIYAEAAHVFAFKTSQVSKYEALACLRRVKRMFSPAQWDRMRALHLLPAEVHGEPHASQRREGRRSDDNVKDTGRWVFITHDPTNPDVHHFLNKLHIHAYDLQYAAPTFLTELLGEAELPGGGEVRNEFIERIEESPDYAFDFELERTDRPLVEDEEREAEINRSALINLFEGALIEGVRRGASDIHICPDERGKVSINFRIDGDLMRWYVEEKAPPEAFLAVVKDRSRNVDRFERERGQDGFIQRVVDDVLIRFRVSVLPIAHADQDRRHESVVIRILDDSKVVDDLGKLGLDERGLNLFKEAIRQPHGMVILTGPTGSGKSTTLYAALHEVRSPKRNVLTVEDPVEYVLPGIRQVKVSHKLGVKEALRFILRHDPDVVMVGEMRDQDTAELGVKLANTGHLTFSTLHTNDAPSAVARLYKMGIEPFLIAHSITLVVAQRLLRVLCPACKQPDSDPDFDTLKRMGIEPERGATLFRATADPGCKNCNGNGYRGRRAITEVMPMDKSLREQIVRAEGNLDEDALRDRAVAEGMAPLKQSAWELVRAGQTSVEEMIRVVGVLR